MSNFGLRVQWLLRRHTGPGANFANASSTRNKCGHQLTLATGCRTQFVLDNALPLVGELNADTFDKCLGRWRAFLTKLALQLPVSGLLYLWISIAADLPCIPVSHRTQALIRIYANTGHAGVSRTWVIDAGCLKG